jgi:filamentous hemagglutinin
VVRVESRAAAELIEARVSQVTQQAKAEGLELITERAGAKGGWNGALNSELKPNSVYLLNNGHAYTTDTLGRVSKAEGLLDIGKMDRNAYQQLMAGQVGGAGYEGGHLIATVLGGAGEKINLIPQLTAVNRGEFRVLEKEWADAIKAGKEVKVEVSPIYSGSGRVPTSIDVTYRIDGKPVSRLFPNTPGG